VPERIANEQDAAVKADLQAQLEAARQTLSTGPQQAQEYYQLALTLADADTPAEDINVVRYFLAYLYYEESACTRQRCWASSLPGGIPIVHRRDRRRRSRWSAI